MVWLVLVVIMSRGCRVWGAGSEGQATVIWYFPHPDDETVGMAGAIQASYEEGNKNVFVFLTRGANTLVRFMSYGGVDRHLSSEELKAARVREAVEALEVLGASSEDIVFLDYPDGQLSRKQALDVMRAYSRSYPGASHRTVSIWDPHPDHRAAAAALRMLAAEENGELDVRFYRVYIFNAPFTRRGGPGVLKEAVPDPEAKRRALYAYRTFDPAAGRYAIGGRSVPSLVRAAAIDVYEYRDTEASPLRGLERIYLALEPSLISVGASYASFVSGWRFDLEGKSGSSPMLDVGVQYKVFSLPAFSGVYMGGKWRTGNRSYLLLGASFRNTLYAEYRHALKAQSHGSGWHWGVRLPLR